jgi:hypothetical protein
MVVLMLLPHDFQEKYLVYNELALGICHPRSEESDRNYHHVLARNRTLVFHTIAVAQIMLRWLFYKCPFSYLFSYVFIYLYSLNRHHVRIAVHYSTIHKEKSNKMQHSLSFLRACCHNSFYSTNSCTPIKTLSLLTFKPHTLKCLWRVLHQ